MSTMDSQLEQNAVFTQSAAEYFSTIGSCVTAPTKYKRVFNDALLEIQKGGLLVGKMNEEVVDGSGVVWNVVDAAKCRAHFAYEEAEKERTEAVKRTNTVAQKNPIFPTVEMNEKGNKVVGVVDPYTGVHEFFDDEWKPDTPMPAHEPTECQLNNERANKERAVERERESKIQFCGTLDQCIPMFVQCHLDQGDFKKVKAWCPCGRGGKLWRKLFLGETDNTMYLEECGNDRSDTVHTISEHCRGNGGPKHAAAHAYLKYLYFPQKGVDAGLANFGTQRTVMSTYLYHNRFCSKTESPTVEKWEGQVDEKPVDTACQPPMKKKEGEDHVEKKPAAAACKLPLKFDEKPDALAIDPGDQPLSKKMKITSAAGNATDPIIID
jgi:hypothetical protein